MKIASLDQIQNICVDKLEMISHSMVIDNVIMKTSTIHKEK